MNNTVTTIENQKLVVTFATNKALRNTYVLLSMTFLFSAIADGTFGLR